MASKIMYRVFYDPDYDEWNIWMYKYSWCIIPRATFICSCLSVEDAVDIISRIATAPYVIDVQRQSGVTR